VTASRPETVLSAAWPSDLDPRTICLSVDVEWAHPIVLEDVVRLFDERGLQATFFCTHAGISVIGHERGLHPNFRRRGDTLAALAGTQCEPATVPDEPAIYRHVLATTKAFAPEAIGSRSHSLFYDSQLVPLYREFGLEYDSTYLLPLVHGLRPVWKEYDVLELPIFFNDHFELKSAATGFEVARLELDRPGLKVINLHPNMMFTNAPDEAFYQSTRLYYHDPERLLEARFLGRGIRSMVVDLLDQITVRQLPTATLGQVNRAWRRQSAQT
jgi:Polysaccharide deacetylase